MRVTFLLASADMSGGCKVVALYARELLARGHQALVVAPAPATRSMRQRARDVLAGDFSRVLPERHISHLELLDVPHRYLERFRPIEAGDLPDADVLVATWWETAAWARDFPRSKGSPAYFIQGYEADLGNEPEDVLKTWDLPSQRITVSSWLVNLIKNRTHDDDVSLIPNAIDRKQFDAPERGKHARPTLGVSYATPHLKGFDVAVRAIERVRKEIPDLQIVSFASQRPRAALPLPPGAQFTYRPAQDAIRLQYAACDVWLSASRAEGFGLPALEAMGCRCPLVSTRYGGPVDFIRDGHNGYLVDVDDDAALARRAIDVLRAPDAAWKSMSDAAYQTAHSYTWSDATAKLEAALERAVQKDPRPRST